MKSFLFENKSSKALQEIYEHLQDDESRRIYAARSLLSLSDDRIYMRDIVRNMSISNFMLDELNKHSNQKKVLYGAGEWGKSIKMFFPDLIWDAWVDKNFSPSPPSINTSLEQSHMITLDELISNYSDACIVVTLYFNFEEVVHWLIERGIPRKNIIVLGESAGYLQYFDLPELPHAKDETFVDLGAFDGLSSKGFFKWTNGNYNKIFLFELNHDHMNLCKKRLEGIPNCVFIEKGAWNCTGNLGFIEDGSASRIAYEGANSVLVTSLDKELPNEEVTFIKMDIEGAELQALEGAKGIIKERRPKLAISVYHKRTDIWEIPQIILSYSKDYKFYLRTYSFTGNDTVLYAL